MMHKPIKITDLDLSFPHKICFQNFSAQIPYGSRLAIIGRNGSGKSTLLKIIASLCSEDRVIGYLPQVILHDTDLSGGQRLNKALTEALSLDPNVLLLDEPTNHLDSHNKKSLIRMLNKYPGTLIIVSHDKELLRQCIDILWHIEHGQIHIFCGNYDDYMAQIQLKRCSIQAKLDLLKRQKKNMHHKLMQEQQRASKSKTKGEKSIDRRKWPTIVSHVKAGRAEETSGRKKSSIDKQKSHLVESLSALRLPEIIVPKFSLQSSDVNSSVVVEISGASVGYIEGQPILSGISLILGGRQRMAIKGDNGSGKSTLIKAILGDEIIYKTGQWYAVKPQEMGYLDQHYGTLDPNRTVVETIAKLVPAWSDMEIRRHLNDFLFRKNEEVQSLVSTLSGGEKVRLSLAQIAAKTPKILILDEVTNNLDLETKEHVVQVLKNYPGAMIIISHDEDFLEEIGTSEVVDVGDFRCFL